MHQGATTPLTLPIEQAVIAGWTGRDPVARDKHIAELEAIGIARPASTPIYYRVSARRLTTADRIEVCGGDSSGEVEFVLIGWQGRIFVGLGSDHTDRKVEAYSVTVSKQMCDKPMAPVLWELRGCHRSLGPDDPARHGRGSTARGCCTRKARSMACCRSQELIAARFRRQGLPDGCAMFGGTFAAKGGIRPATGSNIELEDPVLKRSIRHAYDVIVLPVLG